MSVCFNVIQLIYLQNKHTHTHTQNINIKVLEMFIDLKITRSFNSIEKSGLVAL